MSNSLDALMHDQGLTLDGRPLNPPKDVSAYYPSRTDSNPEGRGRTIPPPDEFTRMSEERRKRVDEALEQAYEDTSPQPISNRYGRWTDSDILSEIMRRETDIQELYYPCHCPRHSPSRFPGTQMAPDVLCHSGNARPCNRDRNRATSAAIPRSLRSDIPVTLTECKGIAPARYCSSR